MTENSHPEAVSGDHTCYFSEDYFCNPPPGCWFDYRCIVCGRSVTGESDEEVRQRGGSRGGTEARGEELGKL